MSATSPTARTTAPRRWPLLAAALVVFALLCGLGTWQVQRLHWKESLIASIDRRVAAAPLPLSDIERQLAATGDVDYQPVTLRGSFVHSGERHFFTTWEGESGFNVYTPLLLDDGRFVFVNRGFVTYDMKDAQRRTEGRVGGVVEITGLARNRLDGKPGRFLPDNDAAKNIFYWKDLTAMAASAGLPPGSTVLPLFVDADGAPNPGGWPKGGVTIIEMPNNHLQYAVTWYGLAAALAGVVLVWLRRARSRT